MFEHYVTSGELPFQEVLWVRFHIRKKTDEQGLQSASVSRARNITLGFFFYFLA